MIDFTKKTLQEYLKEIGAYVVEGLSEKEACILVDFPYNEFTDLKEKNEAVNVFIEKKKIEWKHSHLKKINQGNSAINSQWMLEKLRPEEFGSKRSSGDKEINVIGLILTQIQNSGKSIVSTRGSLPGGDKADGTEILKVESVLK